MGYGPGPEVPIAVAIMMAAAATAANYAGKRKVANERQKAMRLANTRRQEQAKRAERAAQNTTDLLVRANEDEKVQARAIEDSYDQATGPPSTAAVPSQAVSPAAPTGATHTINEQAAAHAAARAESAVEGSLRAKLGAFSDVMAANKLAVARNQADINQEASAMNNWNQYVLPAQLAAANNAGKDWNTLADAINFYQDVYGTRAALTKRPGPTTTGNAPRTPTSGGGRTGLNNPLLNAFMLQTRDPY